MTKEHKVIFQDLKDIRYKDAWDYQEKIFKNLLDYKFHPSDKEKKQFLLFCEHPNVYTLGKSGSEGNLLLNQVGLKDKQVEYFKTNRGGDITYHGPGQIVGYPIIDLEEQQIGVKNYIQKLEEAIILTLKDYGIEAERLKGSIGVWLDADNDKARKICAIGVKSSRYITMHGFAFNVNTNLEFFNYINPCGFVDKGVTSMQKELGKKLDYSEVSLNVKEKLAEVFGFKYE
ncbi:MAG: lipoyl(octanoyl) transferase LipB [Bacteroidota bacterium]|nr:lipoyl(octanoyl) transferase LipB [Bacteroidota bacterium]